MPGPYRVAMKKGEDDLQSYLEQAFGKSDVTSVKMRAAVREWFDLYYGVPRAGEDSAPRVAALIVGKLCRTVFAEYETRLPPEAPDPLRRSLSALNAAAKTAMQYALVGGECLLKPVPRDGAFDFAAIRRDCYVPLARDAHGSLLAVGTMERHSVDGRQYALLERRTAGADGLTIETRLFELNGQTLGRRALQDDLFVGLPDDPANVGVTVYSPTLREGSYLARKQDLLRGCESLLGLRRGILSEVETPAEPRTATEIAATSVDYDLTIRDLQSAWTDTVQQAMALCSALGAVYGLDGLPQTAAPAIDWGDGVLYDRARIWAEQRELVDAGLLRPELALAWYFDLPHETEAELAEIRRRFMGDAGRAQ